MFRTSLAGKAQMKAIRPTRKRQKLEDTNDLDIDSEDNEYAGSSDEESGSE
jgi:hypothetical protein